MCKFSTKIVSGHQKVAWLHKKPAPYSWVVYLKYPIPSATLFNALAKQGYVNKHQMLPQKSWPFMYYPVHGFFSQNLSAEKVLYWLAETFFKKNALLEDFFADFWPFFCFQGVWLLWIKTFCRMNNDANSIKILLAVRQKQLQKNGIQVEKTIPNFLLILAKSLNNALNSRLSSLCR